MVDKKAVLEATERCIAYLKECYGVKRALVFGSARGEGPWHDRSDLDLAVEGLPPEVFFRVWAELQEMLPRDIILDLVPLEDATPELRARILEEVKMPEDPIIVLKELVEDELKMLERTIKEMEDTLNTRSEPPTRKDLRAMASILHDFYKGIESIFERIAVRIDGVPPKGDKWHTDLLNQMLEDHEGVRQAVIDQRLWGLLKDYMDFRHFFRHAYGFALEWPRIRLLARGMEETFELLRVQLAAFFDKMQSKGGGELR